MNQGNTPPTDAATGDGAARGLADERFDERGVPIGRLIDSVWEIGPRDVHRRIFRAGEPKLVREGDAIPVLIDCRTDRELELARIDGALHVPMHEINARLQELRVHEERPVIIFCHTGQRSMQVAVTLREVGFEDVRSMHGGIDLWSQSVDPAVARY